VGRVLKKVDVLGEHLQRAGHQEKPASGKLEV